MLNHLGLVSQIGCGVVCGAHLFTPLANPPLQLNVKMGKPQFRQQSRRFPREYVAGHLVPCPLSRVPCQYRSITNCAQAVLVADPMESRDQVTTSASSKTTHNKGGFISQASHTSKEDAARHSTLIRLSSLHVAHADQYGNADKPKSMS